MDTSVRQSAVLAKIVKARFGLVPTFQRREKKLAVSFWVVQQSKVVGCCPGVQSLAVRGCCVVTPVDMLAIEVTNVQTGVWERRDWRRSESHAWRFVDVDDVVTCDVYAQPLGL